MAAAARLLDVSREAVRRYCDRHPQLLEELEQLKASDADAFEDVIRKAAHAGSWRAAAQWLSVHARDRGWGKSAVEVQDPDEVRKLKQKVRDLEQAALRRHLDEQLPALVAEVAERERRQRERMQ